MPIGALLSALVSGLGIAAESSAQGAQTNLGYANLYETKRQNRKKEKLATADKVDARGNRTYYDPTFGWRIDTSPMTQQILDAEDLETLLSLTEDATRNRDAAIRMDERSIAADDEFEEAFNEYKYRPRKSEEGYVADAQREKLLARRKGADEAAAATNTALIRQGFGSNVPAVYKAAREAEADEFEEVLLGGRRQGIQDFLNIEGAKDNQMQDELAFLTGLADKTTGMPQRFTNRAEQLTGGADEALAGLLSVLNANQGAEGDAMKTLMNAVGQSPNFAPLASSLGRLGDSFTAGFTGSAEAQAAPSGRAVPYPRPYEEGIRARLRAGF